jgi:hypothetical protein
MILSKVFVRRHWQAIAAATGLKEAQPGSTITLADDSRTDITDATIAWVKRIILNIEGNNAAVNLATGNATTGSAPQAQVETLTIVAAGGATSSGNLALTVTGAGITGSPLAVAVPLVSGTHTTAALIAGAVRTKLNTIAAITALYTIGGAGAAVTLTRKANAANDATLNIAVAAGFGVSAVTNSTNTTLGVLGTELINGPNLDVFGDALPVSTVTRFCEISVSGGGSAWVAMELPGAPPADFGNVLLASGSSLRVPYPLTLSIEANDPGAILDIVYFGK